MLQNRLAKEDYWLDCSPLKGFVFALRCFQPQNDSRIVLDVIHMGSLLASSGGESVLAQALPLMKNLASTMLRNGNFALVPGSDAPNAATPIFNAVAHIPEQELLAAA